MKKKNQVNIRKSINDQKDATNKRKCEQIKKKEKDRTKK